MTGGTSAPTRNRSYWLKYRRSYKTTSGVIVGTIIVVIEKEEPSRSGPYSRIFKVQGQDSVEVEKEVRRPSKKFYWRPLRVRVFAKKLS